MRLAKATTFCSFLQLLQLVSAADSNDDHFVDDSFADDDDFLSLGDNANHSYPEYDIDPSLSYASWLEDLYAELEAIETPGGNLLDLLVEGEIILNCNCSSDSASNAIEAAYGVLMSRDYQDGVSLDCRDQEFGVDAKYTEMICDFKEKLDDVIVMEDIPNATKWVEGQLYAASGEILNDASIMSEVVCWHFNPSDTCRNLPEENLFSSFVSNYQALITEYVPDGFDNKLLADSFANAFPGDSIFYALIGSGMEPDLGQVIFEKHYFTKMEELFPTIPTSVPVKHDFSTIFALQITPFDFTTTSIDKYSATVMLTQRMILYKYSSDFFDSEIEKGEMFNWLGIRRDVGRFELTCLNIIAVSLVNDGKSLADIPGFLLPLPGTFDELMDILCANVLDLDSYDAAKNDFVKGSGSFVAVLDFDVEGGNEGSCPEVAPTGCSICGPGKCVQNPNAIFAFPGQPTIPCGLLESVGLSGGLTQSECVLLPPFIGHCECGAPAVEEAPVAGDGGSDGGGDAGGSEGGDGGETIPCSVCGEGKAITNKGAVFNFPGQPAASCEVLQLSGCLGLIPEDQCSQLSELVEIGVCGCSEGDACSDDDGSGDEGGDDEGDGATPPVPDPTPAPVLPVPAPTPAPVPETTAPAPAPTPAPVPETTAPAPAPTPAPVPAPARGKKGKKGGKKH